MPCHHQVNNFYHCPSKQRGAALMVMLVILVMGTAAFLVASLGKAALNIERSKKSSDLLAQAKEVVIGYALTGNGLTPGMLPYPDVLSNSESPANYDGKSEGGCFDSTKPAATPPYTPLISSNVTNMRCLGRLPWSSLDMPIVSSTENDPTGIMPWYTFSRNLKDPSKPINSELLNTAFYPWLTVRDMNGNVVSNRVAFVIIIPGAALPGQSRPPSPNLGGPNQYLDSITVPAGCTAPCIPGTYNNYDLDEDFIMGDEHRWIDDPANPGKQIEDSAYQFNDRLLYVTIDELTPLIEIRIAREAKNCLDNYALTPTGTPSNKYPWAAPISTGGYTSITGTLFGRIPDIPTINTTATINVSNANNPQTVTMLNALMDLQNAVNLCLSNSSNQAALTAAGLALQNAAQAVVSAQPTTPAISSSVTTPAITAGQKAQSLTPSPRCTRIFNGTSTTVQTNLANANAALGAITVTTAEDPSMQLTWPAGCFAAGTYWDDWKRLVLYQVSDNYRPLGTAIPCGGACLSISGSANPNAGSGSYRAAVIMAGEKLGAQTRATQSVSEYLELNNQTNKTDNPSNLTFDTYKPADANYSTVNDLVLCLDGKNNCK